MQFMANIKTIYQAHIIIALFILQTVQQKLKNTLAMASCILQQMAAWCVPKSAEDEASTQGDTIRTFRSDEVSTHMEGHRPIIKQTPWHNVYQ